MVPDSTRKSKSFCWIFTLPRDPRTELNTLADIVH